MYIISFVIEIGKKLLTLQKCVETCKIKDRKELHIITEFKLIQLFPMKKAICNGDVTVYVYLGLITMSVKVKQVSYCQNKGKQVEYSTVNPQDNKLEMMMLI